MLISNQLIIKARSLLALVVLISFQGTALADESEIAFDIDVQELGAALNEFALQSNKEILFVEAETADKSATKVSGTYAPTAALDLLLADTGLKYRVNELDTVLVGAAADQRGASDSKNLTGPTPVLMAQNQTSQAQTTSNRSDDGGTSIVTGKVTDARTGANLKGALVTIEETGQSTSTNDLGEFRLVNVPTGSATITVSYLGYAGQSAVVGVRRDGTSQNFALRGGSEIEEIIVVGQRSARALALNQERTAENSITVVTSDVLGKFPGATLAETLRRAPGITFQEDSRTGEGTNVIVRGLAPELNQIRFDGQRLAEGSGRGRSPSIGNLLTDTIDEVTISKTLLPSQDSNGSGGLIEITTRGPLDRPRRFAQFSAETERNADFTESDQLSGTLSGIFGSRGQFGLSASVQYRQSENQTIRYFRDLNPSFSGAFGPYLPLAADGSVITTTSAISPLTRFPFEAGASDVYPVDINSSNFTGDVETTAGTLAAQWKPFEHTDLRLSYTRTERKIEDFEQTARFFAGGFFYEPLPIDDLGGEVRGAQVWEDGLLSFLGVPGLLGRLNHEMDFNETDETTDVLSFQGETSIGPWDFDYRLGRSTGERITQDGGWSYSVNGDIFGVFLDFAPELLDPTVFSNLIDGRVVSAFAPASPGDSGLQLPLLSPAGFSFFNDPANYSVGPFDSISLRPLTGENTRESFAFSTRRSFQQSPLQYLEAGVEYESTRFDSLIGDSVFYRSADGNPISLDDLGLNTFRSDNLSAIGLSSGFLTPTTRDLEALIRSLQALSTGPDPQFEQTVSNNAVSDPGTFTDEEELALYLQARVDIGDFEIIGGVRFSRVDVQARSLSAPTIRLPDGTLDLEFSERFRRLIDNKGAQSSLLPRVSINWRPDDNFIVRGGYFQSVARPRVDSLSGNQSVDLDLRPLFGINGDQPALRVFQGNPDLEPSITHSFDLSAALYDKNAGVLELSLFYKNIEDFLEFTSNANSPSLEGVILPDDPRFQNLPNNIFVDVTRPTNNDESAEIYGVELSAERQFVQLPGVWSGLGVFANYTYTDSEKFFIFNNVVDPVAGEFVDVEVSGVPFDQSPKHSGTVALTYNKYGVDASLSYSAQSERLDFFGGYGLSAYNDSDDTLDLRIEYQVDAWNGTWRVFLAGQDLLKGTEDPDTLRYIGESDKYYTDGTFFGGRTIIVGFSGTY